MAKRDTHSLDESPDHDSEWSDPSLEDIKNAHAVGDSSERLTESASGWEAPERVKKVQIHYPRAVYLSQILPEISKWSGFNFVMDPALNRQMQVFAPRKIPKDDAFQVFVASLETVGLRALQIDSGLIKIVSNTFGQRTA